MKFRAVFLLPLCLLAVEPTTAIKVDQVGYFPSAPKLAFVVSDVSVEEFVLRTKSGDRVLSGKLSAAVKDADSGDAVRTADFSKLTKAGDYFLEVPGVGRSWNFAIGPKVMDHAYYLSMRSFYGQRCGTAVDMGDGFKHEICHTDGAYHASSGKSGPMKQTGGWHDAGDYGRYVVNSGISTGTLLWAYELYGKRIGNIGLKLPESGNHTPDILNEIRWNLNWMLSMQDEDGGVWHKQTSERFCGFVMPEKDTLTSYVIGTGAAPFKSSCATADLAAVAAIAARVYKPFDKAFAEKSLVAAKKAVGWLKDHPDVLYRNPNGVSTGGYGDRDCSDERLWAAVELWRTTGEGKPDLSALAGKAGTPPAWANVAPMAVWSYLLGGGKDEGLRKELLTGADQIVERTATNGYRISLTAKDYIWGSNSVAANYGMLLLVANHLTKERRYANAAVENLHYLLGRNTFSLSYVTQLGEHAFSHPHHRPSGAMSKAWPGLLAGGPNHSKQDPAMRKMPDLPPAKMYLDEQESYASNEIAINWNAPLVFLLAGAAATN